jgi:3-oxoacyl-[acyl-carrier protein] reductase
MSDRYIDFANSTSAIAWSQPLACRRRYAWNAGKPGACARWKVRCCWAAARWQGRCKRLPTSLTDAIYSYGCESSTWIPGHGPKLKAVVFDASDLQHTDQLKQLREFFQPLLKNLRTARTW